MGFDGPTFPAHLQLSCSALVQMARVHAQGCEILFAHFLFLFLSHLFSPHMTQVECTFGILKGRYEHCITLLFPCFVSSRDMISFPLRWRILKTGVRLHGAAVVDKIWKTCCALHNWLLEVDGLNAEWKLGVPSDFEGELGDHDLGDSQVFVPSILERVRNCTDFHGRLETFDPTTLGNVDWGVGDEGEDEGEDESQGASSCSPGISIRSLSLVDFRERLVQHFRYRWERKGIKWPSRTGVVEYELR